MRYFSARLTSRDIDNAFNYIDADRNGKINLDELKSVCKEVVKEKSPGNIADTKVVEVFKSVDANKDGVIDLQEFRNIMKTS